MDLQVPHNFTPRGYQLELFRAMEGIGQPKKKRAFLRWHRRAGKDFCCLAYMFYAMFKRKGIYYYFMPNYSQGRKIIWEGINKDGMKFLDLLPRELIQRINNQDMLLELKNGSIFRVIGTDNIDSIVGTNPVGCIFSEYSLQDPSAWNFIRPILAENDGWAIFNGTPRGRNHMYDMDKAVKKMGSWYYSTLQTLWPEKPNYSGIVSAEVIEEERQAGMDEDTIEQEFGVSYSAGVQGAFYADVLKKAHAEKRIGNFPPDPHTEVNTYWDLGSTDDTAIWFVQRSGSAYNIIDYYEDNGKEIAEYVKVLKDMGYNYGTHHLPWDGDNRSILSQQSARQLLEEACKAYRISSDTYVAAKPKVQQGIDSVRRMFSRLYFHEPNCEDGIAKLELYHRKFDPKRQVFLKEPVHDYCSHAADALRTMGIVEVYEYGLNELGGKPPIKIISEFDPRDDL